jgi:hypothetical protein
MTEIKTFTLRIDPSIPFTRAEEQARHLIGPDKRNLTLLAWWDSTHKTGGPREACSDETLACVASYAHAHGSEYRVRVNGGQLELFYGAPTGHFEELDRQMVAEVHRHTRSAGFDNIQGG